MHQYKAKGACYHFAANECCTAMIAALISAACAAGLVLHSKHLLLKLFSPQELLQTVPASDKDKPHNTDKAPSNPQPIAAAVSDTWRTAGPCVTERVVHRNLYCPPSSVLHQTVPRNGIRALS